MPIPFAIYVHDLNPFAIKLWGDFGIRWYGLSYLLGFYLAYLIISYMSKRALSPLKSTQVSDFIVAAALGTIIGGRLGYCLFYSPDLLFGFSKQFPFWDALAINRGGMASHGGMIGIVVACIIWGRIHKYDPLHLFDLSALGACLGIFLGRIANFINGELVGRATSGSIAVKFPQDILLWPEQEPQRLANLSSVVSSLGVSVENWQTLVQSYRIEIRAWNQIEMILNRIIFEIQSGNALIKSALAPLLTPRHPSQLYQALLEGLFLFLFLCWVWRKPQKPGVITALFFCMYAIVRILGEQFRMPDAQLGFQALGLTRGQWLSFGLFFCGLILFWFCSRRKADKVGGFVRSD